MDKLTFNVAGDFWKMGDTSPYMNNAPYVFQSCDGNRIVTTLGIGSATGFDIDYYIGRNVGKNLAQYICQTQLSTPECFEKAFLSAAEYLAREFPFDPTTIGSASSTILCVLIENNEASIAWLGNEQAYLIRDGQIVQRTQGHTIAQQQLERLSPEWRQIFARYPTRYLSVDERDSNPTPELLSTPWRLLMGDRIVLVTQRLLEGLREEAIPDLIHGKTVGDAAHSLVQEAIKITEPYHWSNAAIVVEVL